MLLKDVGSSHIICMVDSGISMQPSSEQLQVVGHDMSTRHIDCDLALPPAAVSQSQFIQASAGYSSFASVQLLQQQLL